MVQGRNSVPNENSQYFPQHFPSVIGPNGHRQLTKRSISLDSMEAYPLILTLHSWVRWLVLLTGLWALVNAFMGMQARGPLTSRAPFAAFMGSMHLQVLLGIALFAVMGMSGMAPFPDQRPSFGWEHLGMAVVSAIFATLANRAAKAPQAVMMSETAVQVDPVTGAETTPTAATSPIAFNDAGRWRSVLMWTVLAWIPVLLLMPWTRPMLRMFGA